MDEVGEHERSFSVELTSTTWLKSLVMSSDPRECVLIEGTVGAFRRAAFREGLILEIAGDGGTLRVEMREDELERGAVDEAKPGSNDCGATRRKEGTRR
jgi:hypothetical protein